MSGVDYKMFVCMANQDEMNDNGVGDDYLSAFTHSNNQLDNEHRNILKCISTDNAQTFANKYLHLTRTLLLNVDMLKLSHQQKYIAHAFPIKLHSITLVHIATIFSAHAILKVLCQENSVEYLWLQSMEGINCIHLAAALGDYIALQIFLKRGAPTKDVDSLGRSALHYAAQTNIESMIQLMVNMKTLLVVEDHHGAIPVNFANERINLKNFNFLKVHTDLFMENLNAVTIDREGITFEKLRNAPLLFDSYLCLRSAKLGYTCTCFQRDRFHEQFDQNEAFQDLIKTRQSNFIRRPTNAYGQFESPFTPVISQFIRLTDDTEIERLHTLLFELWQLSKPGLCLTFYGSDPESPALIKMLQKSLGQLTRKTLTWLLTDGQADGSGEIVAQAMRGYAEAYGMHKLQVIGMAPWRMLVACNALISYDYLGKSGMSFPKKASTLDKRIQLAENHTHYIFVDSMNKKKSCLALCRAQFEAYMARLIQEKDEGNLNRPLQKRYPQRLNSVFFESQRDKGLVIADRTPVCGILVGGGIPHLKGLCLALQQNTPFVVISDTGGLASLLEKCVDFMRSMQPLHLFAQRAPRLQWSQCHTSLKKLPELTNYIPNMASSDIIILEEILEYAFLLEFITSNTDQASMLESKILKSLIKPELFEGVGEKDIWMFKLRIALQLNRTDFLSENMFSRVHWHNMNMDFFVETSLIENKKDFLQLLVDSGFPLHEYITVNLLEKLYTEDYFSSEPRIHLLRYYSLRVLRSKITRISMIQISRILNSILGHKIGKYELKRIEKSIGNETESSSDGDIARADGEDRLLDLLIWSFICRRFELSYLIWALMKEAIPAALLLANFGRKMKEVPQSVTEADELDRIAQFFEQSAVGVLNECYINDTVHTLTMLSMKRPSYGNLSQLLLAESGNCMNFIEHQACQTSIQNMWHQNLADISKIQVKLFVLLIGIVFPPLIPLVATFKDERISNRTTFQFARNSVLQEESKVERERSYSWAKRYVTQIQHFYSAPSTRFAYSSLSCLTLLLCYSSVIVLTIDNSIFAPERIALHFLGITVILENIRKSVENKMTFKNYWENRWNQVIFIGFLFYIFGNLNYVLPVSNFPLLYLFIRLCLTTNVLIASAFLLRFFVVSRYVGPKLMMIKCMVQHDLLPFLAIIFIFWLAFSLFTVANIYRPFGAENKIEHLEFIFDNFRSGFFQMFGEFDISDNINNLKTIEDECERFDGCVYPLSKWLYPIIKAVYCLITSVVLINLLIAMFTKRYDTIEIISKQIWAMQKFQLVRTFANSAPIPPPYALLWPYICVIRWVWRICRREEAKTFTTFCYSINDERLERQLINWQKFCSLDHLRNNPSKIQSVMLQSKKSKVDSKFDAEVKGQKNTIDKFKNELGRQYSSSQIQMLDMKLDSICEALERKNKKRASLRPVSASTEEASIGFTQLTNVQFESLPVSPTSVPMDSKSPISTFNYRNHKIAFFRNPGDDKTPHGLPKLIAWNDDLPTYEPIVFKRTDKAIPDWQEQVGFKNLDDEPSPNYGSMQLNPTGRTGTAGRGLLPDWGANPVVFLIITMEEILPYNQEMKEAENITRKVILRPCHLRKHQLPWFFCKHMDECDQVVCMQGLVMTYLQTLAHDALELNSTYTEIYKTILKGLESCSLQVHHLGPLEDKVNCDNAWIDITAVNVRLTPLFHYWERIPQLFSAASSEAIWVNLNQLPPIKKSHFSALAYFHESFIRHPIPTSGPPLSSLLFDDF